MSQRHKFLVSLFYDPCHDFIIFLYFSAFCYLPVFAAQVVKLLQFFVGFFVSLLTQLTRSC